MKIKKKCTNSVDFKLVSALCKSSSEHGGSRKDGLETKVIVTCHVKVKKTI